MADQNSEQKKTFPFPTLLIIALFFSTLCSAQSGKIEIGIESGPNLSNIIVSKDQKELYDPVVRFSSGPTIQYHFSDLFSLQTALAFEMKGSAWYLSFADQSGNILEKVEVLSTFNYLTLPVLARFSFGKNTKFFVNAGPYFAYLIKHNVKIDAFGTFPETKTDNTDNFRRFDAGVSAGIGAAIPIKDKIYFSIEARNNLGLKDASILSLSNSGRAVMYSSNLLVGISYRI